jgi:hypothetical protein
MSSNPFAAPKSDGSINPNESAFAEVFTRELTATELFVLALRVFSAKPWLIIGITLAIGVPVNFLAETLAPVHSDDLGELGRNIRMIVWLDALIGVLASIGLARLTEKVVRGEHVSALDVVSHMMRRWLAGIGTRVLYNFGVGLMLLLLIVPGVAFMVFWLFCDQAVALRYKSGTAALSLSKELVRGRWWRIAGALLFLSVVVGFPVLLVSVGGGVLLELFNGQLAITMAIDTLSDLLLSVVAIAVTLLFLNLEAMQAPEVQEI